jgi:DNA segregation ATPase FtsK/SpoIIIE, S-DNA-T family
MTRRLTPPWNLPDDPRDPRSGRVPGAELVRRPSSTPAHHSPTGQPAAPSRTVVHAVAVVRQVVTDDRTRGAVRWVVRNAAVYPVTGGYVLVRRWWEAHTNSRYERLLRAAETAGDHDRLTDWEARAEHARERRHRRRMDWITAPLDLARTVAVGLMCGIGILIVLGGVLAIAHHDPAWLLSPAQRAVDAIAWLVWLLDFIWLPIAVALPWLTLAMLWRVGRHHGSVPRWAAPPGSPAHASVIVTPVGSPSPWHTWASPH